MCGIVGVVGPDPGAFPFDKALSAIEHRGPNDRGSAAFEGAILGNTRLSILDLSPAGHQPMSVPEADLTIVHNGEVYNYKELRAELGYRWRSGTDTEVVLRAFQERGAACLEQLNGMFSFAVWSEKDKRLFAARDRLGIKPFYYAFYDGHFLFASEIKALLVLGHPRVPNDSVIWQYLARGLYEHTDETFFQGIRKLPSGHFLTYSQNSGLSIERYWNLEEEALIPAEEAEEGFRSHLEQIIDWETRSDVPVGILFSGGMDSSALLALMSRRLGRGIPAFSYAFHHEDYDQSRFMKPVIDCFKSTHDVSYLEPEEFWEDFSDTLWFQEEPTGSITITAFKKVFQGISDAGVGVVLTGNGLDELLAGYRPYHEAYLADLLDIGSPLLAPELDAYCGEFGAGRNDVLRRLHAFDLDQQLRLASVDGTKHMLAPCLRREFADQHRQEIEIRSPFRSRVRSLMYRDLMKVKIPRMLRFGDRMSMRFGKELRPPFLNHLLVEYCFRLPPDMLIRGGQAKWILRQAMKDRLPKGFTGHPKRHVTHPQREWLRSDLKQQVRDLIRSRSFRERPFFDPARVEHAYDRWVAGEGDNSFFIWQWVNMEIWMRTFIDPTKLEAPAGVGDTRRAESLGPSRA